MTHTRATCMLGRDKCTPENAAQGIHCVSRHTPGLDARELCRRIGCSYDWFIKVTADGGRPIAPAWLLLALAANTGRTEHLATLAHDAGLLTYRPSTAASLSGALGPVLRQFATVVEEFETMHADGRVDPFEARRFTRECTQMAALLLAAANDALHQAGLPSLPALTTQEVA